MYIRIYICLKKTKHTHTQSKAKETKEEKRKTKETKEEKETGNVAVVNSICGKLKGIR